MVLSVARYTVGAGGLSAGTRVDFDATAGTVSVGSLTVVAAMDISSDGDQLTMFSAPDATCDVTAGTMLFAINFSGGSFWSTTTTTDDLSALPPGLIDDETAVTVTEADNAVFVQSRVRLLRREVHVRRRAQAAGRIRHFLHTR